MNRASAFSPNLGHRKLSDRLRKRRCFADKELNSAIITQDRAIGLVPTTHPGILLPTRGSNSGNPPADGRVVLKKLFPTLNEHVLELVWQGCNGDVGLCINHLITSFPRSRDHSVLAGTHYSSFKMSRPKAEPVFNNVQTNDPVLNNFKGKYNRQLQNMTIPLPLSVCSPPDNVLYNMNTTNESKCITTLKPSVHNDTSKVESEIINTNLTDENKTECCSRFETVYLGNDNKTSKVNSNVLGYTANVKEKSQDKPVELKFSVASILGYK